MLGKRYHRPESTSAGNQKLPKKFGTPKIINKLVLHPRRPSSKVLAILLGEQHSTCAIDKLVIHRADCRHLPKLLEHIDRISYINHIQIHCFSLRAVESWLPLLNKVASSVTLSIGVSIGAGEKIKAFFSKKKYQVRLILPRRNSRTACLTVGGQAEYSPHNLIEENKIIPSSLENPAGTLLKTIQHTQPVGPKLPKRQRYLRSTRPRRSLLTRNVDSMTLEEKFPLGSSLFGLEIIKVKLEEPETGEKKNQQMTPKIGL